MQAKDIPDAVFLDAVRRTPGTSDRLDDGAWRMRWNVKAMLESALGHVIPEKVFLAKARKLMARALLGGCDCGCRGDYHLPVAQGSCCYACDMAMLAAGASS